MQAKRRSRGQPTQKQSRSVVLHCGLFSACAQIGITGKELLLITKDSAAKARQNIRCRELAVLGELDAADADVMSSSSVDTDTRSASVMHCIASARGQMWRAQMNRHLMRSDKAILTQILSFALLYCSTISIREMCKHPVRCL